jgi:peptide/nickel transport system permease protein
VFAHVIGRLTSGLLVLWLVSLLAFSLLALTPGDPARLILSATSADVPTPEEVTAKRAELGLDRPAYARYFSWLGGVVRGDFGNSYRTSKPVGVMYAERLPATLLLTSLTITISLAAALPLGLVAAIKRGGFVDALAQVVAVLGAAVPGFWIALVLILIFAATLRWLPALGSPTMQGMILPALVLALPNIAVLSRLTRAAILDALRQEYMTIARAKGRSQRGAIIFHALPNVAVTLITPVALDIAYLLTGTVIIETVFAYPGVGRLAVDAALVGDMPVLALCVLAAGGVYVVCNWCADIGMAALDPRLGAG